MAKFSQYTLNQVGGFDGQVLAQELVYAQKDFWNFAWVSNVTSSNGWDTTSTPMNLTGATITANIIRRQVTGRKDTRCGLDLTIEDYPTPAAITTVSASSSTNYFTAADTGQMFVDEPVRFTGNVFGGVAINTTYYVLDVPTASTFSISTSTGGPVMTLSPASGSMTVNRAPPTAISLPITNITPAYGTFILTIDSNTWGIISGDPELDINATFPIAFTGYVKVAMPAVGSQPAYDEQVFLLFLINSNGVTN
jgi:hypothetical protein